MKKMQMKVKVLFILVLFISNYLFSLTFKELVKKLEEKDNEIKKLKADYVQLIHFLDLNETYVLNARFLYVYPEKLRVDIESPFQQIIIVDSKKLVARDISNDIIYYADTEKYFKEQQNYFPFIFSKTKKYKLSDFVKKANLKLVKEEEKFYVLSSRYVGGKSYSGDKKGLEKNETRLMLWICKETLFPKKVNMISEKYVIETEFNNYEIEFDVNENLFEIEKTSNTKIIEIK